MYIAYTEEQEQLRAELRAYYAKMLTPEVREALHEGQGVGPTNRELVKQMGDDGWLGLGWPEEYGGRGMSQVEQYLFFDESMRMGAPIPMLTINTVGPSIYQFGSKEMKDFFLPKILAGDIHFCIGYSEPEAGTDLASLTTRAERDGEEYVVTGQKMWTSLASDADYCWLAVRTNAEAKKHKGISILVMDMAAEGLTIDPLHLLSSHDINAMFLDEVRIPAERLVGEENQGWTYITNQLNHERVTLCSSGLLEQSFDEVKEFATETKLPDGRRVIDQEWVQMSLARVFSGIELIRLLNWKVASSPDGLDVADASSIKVYGTEFYLEAFRLLMEILGPQAYLCRNSAADLLHGRLEMNYRSLLILTFGGGTNEIQRDLIAMFGMGMPRALRS